jgi:cellulose biosynthesis protein BcsQ
MVDADPQCNLTAILMGDKFDSYYEEAPTNDRNIKDGVTPAFEGKMQPIEPFDAYQVPRQEGLFLLPGHPNLSELEPQLSFAQESHGTFAAMKNLPGAFHYLIHTLVQHHAIDCVLIDLNPGLGAINQNLFSISDAFIIPTNPDLFSLMAIDKLSTVLPRWVKQAKGMQPSFQDASYPLPDYTPKLAGVLLQRFNIRKGVAARPFRSNMDDIMNKVREKLIPALEKSRMLYGEELYESIQHHYKYCLAEIPDFQSLVQKSNQFSLPVFELDEASFQDVGGIVKDNLFEKVKHFGDIFEEISTKILLIQEHAASRATL